MQKISLEELIQTRVVAILRNIPLSAAEQTAQALLSGGITAMEVTLDNASESGVQRSLECIRLLCSRFGGDAMIGAGTVLTPAQVHAAAEAGARYIISPDTNKAVIRETKELGALSIPGAMTPTEVVAAHRWGADIVKIFPAGTLGAGYIRALRGPLGHIPLMAVGGIDSQNAADYLRAGAVCLGAGGKLLRGIADGEADFAAVAERARELRLAAERL